MTETQLFAELSKCLRTRGYRCWKLHNDSMQRGFPDCALMKKHTQWAELKVAASAQQAWKELGKPKNSKQYSVLRGMTEMLKPPLLIYADTLTKGFCGGAVLLGEELRYVEFTSARLETLIVDLANTVEDACEDDYKPTEQWTRLMETWR